MPVGVLVFGYWIFGKNRLLLGDPRMEKDNENSP